MGKPFKSEIDQIPNTIDWAVEESVEELKEFLLVNSRIPLYIVGSGGSLSACYFAANLYQKNGGVAKAITPLEMYYSKEAIKGSKVLFISSSGKNTDILFAFNIAIQQEPKEILSVCMKNNAPLVSESKKYSISKGVEYKLPSKKDGFLATNSLVSYFVLLSRAFQPLGKLRLSFTPFLQTLQVFIDKINPQYSITVLYGGWGQAVAYDIESKFTEAALGNILLSDYRNFGHGRHHWFAKRGDQSAIVALVSPEESQIAAKTLALIPKSIPILVIESNEASAASSIELLVKSFYLVDKMGEIQKIDPGRPGVPDFGSKLYHLKYSAFYKLPKNIVQLNKEIHISRKANVNNLGELNQEELAFWEIKYNDYHRKMKDASFGIVIFDYDGTICSSKNRETGLDTEIKDSLLRLLNENIVIGIATGRGKSVREEFNSWIPQDLKKNVIIGYYNGSDVGSLLEQHLPDKVSMPDSFLEKFNDKILELKRHLVNIDVELRPNQLTIKFTDCRNSNRLKELVRASLFKPEFATLEMLESSHSVDIIVRPKISKLNIIKLCQGVAEQNKKSLTYLCIGDRGKWPGNDFELLATRYSLSVEEVSSDPETCWNLASVGIKNSEAAHEYLTKMEFHDGNIKLHLE